MHLHEYLERAALAAMAEARAPDIERSLGHAAYVFGPRNEHEARLRVHKAADRPRGRDAIDVECLSRDVAHVYRSRRPRARALGVRSRWSVSRVTERPSIARGGGAPLRWRDARGHDRWP